MSFKKHYFLFIFFGLFVLVLVPTGTSLATLEKDSATIVGPGCESAGTVTYCTECNECFGIGNCTWPCCKKKCCDWDENGNCTGMCCVAWCEACSCEDLEPWYEYKCDSQGCDGDIFRRECEVYHSGGPCQMGSCIDESCCVKCSEWELCRECGSWQKPIRGEPCTYCPKAGLQTPDDIFKCKCKGECIDTPVNDKYFNDPTVDLDSSKNCYLLHTDNSNLSCYDQDLKQALLDKIASSTMESNNVFLPVKLDWDPVRGDVNGWAEGDECKICKDCPEGCSAECYDKPECVKSYEIIINGEMRSCEALKKIDELKEDIEKNPQNKAADENEIKTIRKNDLEIPNYATTTNKSEFIPPCSCMFKSNRTYKWKVRGCCPTKEALDAMSEAEKNAVCGPWSDTWQFTTSPAPEPKLPYDPDWAGPGGAENLSKEEIGKLEWCEINDPQRYGRIIIGKDEEWYSPQSDKVFIHYLDPQSVQYKCHPNLETSKGCEPMLLTPDPESKDPFSSLIHPFEFVDKDYVYFTKLNSYSWKVSAAEGFAGYNPTEYSQEWKFSVENFPLPQPQLGSPPDNTKIPVGLPVLLKWASPYAHSFNYIVEGGGKIMSGKTDVHNITFDFPKLFLDTIYRWKINPCWDYRAEECENFWAGSWSFITTGRPPNPDTMKPAGTDIPIPVNFEWESVPGAKSFIFKISGKEPQIVKESKIILDYPDLYQETDYSWQVQTCARDNGNVCGAWSSTTTFKTFKLSAPSNPSPPDNQKVFTYEMPGNFSWGEVPYARYYKYTINYVSKSADEATEECQPQEGIVEKIVTQPSDFVSLNCLGKYEWQVTACLDASCQETGDPSSIWLFELVQSGGPGGGGFVGSLTGGLVPCGRTFDDPNTLWNERESCQIKHIFIMIKTIIDFLLWKLAPLLLVFLLVYTGAIYYLAMGAPEAIARVKSLWRAAGIGYLLIFIAWNIVSFVLTLFGYRVGIFGPWWKIF